MKILRIIERFVMLPLFLLTITYLILSLFFFISYKAHTNIDGFHLQTDGLYHHNDKATDNILLAMAGIDTLDERTAVISAKNYLLIKSSGIRSFLSSHKVDNRLKKQFRQAKTYREMDRLMYELETNPQSVVVDSMINIYYYARDWYQKPINDTNLYNQIVLVWKKCQSPTVRVKKFHKSNYGKYIFFKNRIKSTIIPVKNCEKKNFVSSELAHSMQFKKRYWLTYIDLTRALLLCTVRSLYNFKTPRVNYQFEYNNKKSFEYAVHTKKIYPTNQHIWD